MKNIHILQTDKASRLHYFTANKAGYYLYTNKLVVPRNPNYLNQNIYITSDEEIKKGDIVKLPCGVGKVRELNWKYGNDFPSYVVEDIFTYKLRYGQKESELQINSFNYEDVKKIILTTDQELIKDGVQAIDDEFLEWFVKNPSCENVEVETYFKKIGVETDANGWREMDVLGKDYRLIIPKEEPDYTALLQPVGTNQEILEEAAKDYAVNKSSSDVFRKAHIQDFIEGAKWKQEQDKKMYSEEDLIDAFNEGQALNVRGKLIQGKEWFKQLKDK